MERPDWVDDDLLPFRSREVAGLHVLDEGEGTPVLMVHGNPTWSFLWRDVIRALPGFRCVAVDLPGMGLSPAPAGFGFRAHEHAAAVAAVIEALDLRDYVLAGQDWGGPIGLAAAGRAPERVAGLVLANTWAWELVPKRPTAWLWSFALGGVPGRYAWRIRNDLVEVAMRGGCRKRRPTGRVVDHYRAPFPTAASREPTWRFAREVTGAGRFLREEAEPALRALADRPALLPWGDKDPVLGRELGPMADRLDGAVVHPLRGAGHFVQEDAPEELAAAVRARFG